MPAKRYRIAVICTANICRSVYATDLLSAALADTSIEVVAAGVSVLPVSRTPTCPQVVQRIKARGRPAPADQRRLLDAELISTSDLVLTMDTNHRGAVGRLVPEARPRTFTLIEGTVLAEALAERRGMRQPFPAWRDSLSALRGRVPMPTTKAPREGWWPLRRAEYIPDINVSDGHSRSRNANHKATLNRVEKFSERFATALLSELQATDTEEDANQR